MGARPLPVARWVLFIATALLPFVAGAIAWPDHSAVVTTPWSFSAYVFAATGAVILSRRPGHPVGRLLFLYGLLAIATMFFLALATVWSPTRPVAAGWADAVGNALSTAGVLTIPAVFLRFPEGNLLSPRWRWAAWLVGVTATVGAVAAMLNSGWGGDADQAIAVSPLRAATEPWGDVASSAFYPMMTVTMMAAGWSLIMRFRRSHGEERQQMKWLALAAAFLGVVLTLISFTAGSVELETGWQVALVAAAFSSVPIAVAVAVLRYRLYDLDVIINRTLVYGALSAVLASVYVAGVVGLGGIVRDAFGPGDNSLVVAGTTLVVAALFRPIRDRIQRLIDMHFSRRRYDAARAMEDFSTRLRSQVSLPALTAELKAAVRNTVHPAHVSVWLREPRREEGG